MDWDIENADTLRGQIWAKLTRAKADHRSAWRTPVIATVGSNGPAARTVVLREVEPDHLAFHTDARSAKVVELQNDPRVSWVFWDSRQNVQLRVCTIATLHCGDDRSRSAWSSQSPSAHALFLSAGKPGAPFGDQTRVQEPFVWVRCHVQSLDWLWLKRPSHIRFSWKGPIGERVVP